jgi:hypothetical protein
MEVKKDNNILKVYPDVLKVASIISDCCLRDSEYQCFMNTLNDVLKTRYNKPITT